VREEQKAVFQNKTIPLIQIFLSIFICSVGLFVLFIDYFFTFSAQETPLSVRVIGLFTFAMGFLIGYLFAKELFLNEPLLQFGPRGFIDRSTKISVGEVLWEDVASIETKKIVWQKFIVVHVKNPEKYIARKKGCQQRALKANIKYHGTPICITSDLMAIRHKELEELFDHYFLTNIF